MRSIKFDQLGRKAPSSTAALLAEGAAALAAAPTLAQAPPADPARPRPPGLSPRPSSDSDAAVSAGSPKP